MKGVGSTSRATLRGGWRLSGGASSASAAAEAAKSAVGVSKVVRGRRGDCSVLRGVREGEKAVVTANVIDKAAAWIFMIFVYFNLESKNVHCRG